jgi:hypothetical protein
VVHTEGWKATAAWVLDFSQPLKPTTSIVQQKAKQVTATATLRNIITSMGESLVATKKKKVNLDYHHNPGAWRQT